MFEVEFITLTSIYFLALLSPGQDFFLIIKHALTHGYHKAWWSCLGIASGNALYIALAYMGHAYLSQYPFIVSFIEIGGALFLLYLGCLLLFAPQPSLENSLHVKRQMAFKLFAQGFLSALLNPKNILFYFSLLFTIVKPETALHVKMVYAVWMVTMLLVWDMFVAFLFGNQRALRLLPYLNVLQKIVGIGLIGFSLKLAFTFYKQCEL
ncbi:LysE family translocator [Sulfurospirillum diekertiae]|uniref:Threonine efflux protein n=1 Tax=Sulfurospirillum diekertiae TaxID=1854492 RepID=A0A1Y0HPA4_9BACT|nr:LysE family translocator [Sulfurospirillum diekertiae]ARU49396.1 Threonine efflux protein [Sulfurospirillum diekertiae]ASC94203.1 Threonine efflux protein [Sulfurospirillum diekertiae]